MLGKGHGLRRSSGACDAQCGGTPVTASGVLPSLGVDLSSLLDPDAAFIRQPSRRLPYPSPLVKSESTCWLLVASFLFPGSGTTVCHGQHSFCRSSVLWRRGLPLFALDRVLLLVLPLPFRCCGQLATCVGAGGRDGPTCSIMLQHLLLKASLGFLERCQPSKGGHGLIQSKFAQRLGLGSCC